MSKSIYNALGYATAFVLLFIPGIQAAHAEEAWPGSTGTTIATLSEPSGVIWHADRQSLFVVEDNGWLRELSSSGTVLHSWNVGGDLEGVTIAESSDLLYLGIEHPDSIKEFSLSSGSFTGKVWDLTPFMQGADNQGLEGLTYMNGIFLAGLQADGKIYSFDVNLSQGGDVQFIESILPYSSYTSDISDLYYDDETEVVYALYDSRNRMVTLNSELELLNRYALPGDNQEGVTVVPDCDAGVADVYIGEDDGQVMLYTGFPVSCVPQVIDLDEDGVPAELDCDDNNAAISENQTYFADNDEDGLGDALNTSAVCSLSAPVGFVTNSSDANDNDFDNDGSETGVDCDDADASIALNQTYYADADGDGLGDPNNSQTLCSYIVPVGHVTNADDLDDNDDGQSPGIVTAEVVGTTVYISVDGEVVASRRIFRKSQRQVRVEVGDFYSDGVHEIVVTSFKQRRRGKVIVLQYDDETLTYVKKEKLRFWSKKYNLELVLHLESNVFTTTFQNYAINWFMPQNGQFYRL